MTNNNEERMILTLKQWLEYPLFGPGLVGEELMNLQEYAHHKRVAKEDLLPPNRLHIRCVLPHTWRRFQDLFWANSADFHGQGLVSKENHEDGKRVALWVSIANAWNTTTMLPLFVFTFANMPAGLALAGLTGVGWLKGSNVASAGFAQSNARKRLSSLIWGCAVIALNVIGTAFSGPGLVMLLDREFLNTRHAAQMTNAKVIKPLEAQLQNQTGQEELEKLKAECQAALDEMSRLPHGHPRRVDLWSTYKGPHGTPLEYWKTVPDEQLPRCLLAQRLETRQRAAKAKIQATLDATYQAIADQGELAYLREHRQALYAVNFDEEGNIRSGPTTVKLALQSFFDQWNKGDWTGLGIQLFSFSISLVTSVLAIALIWAHSMRADTADTHRLEAENARNAFFENLHRAINKL